MLSLLLAACSPDYGLKMPVDPQPGLDSPADTAAEELPTEDSDPVVEPAPEDSDSPVEEEPVDSDPPAEDDCEDTSDLVYVISRSDRVLSLFDPASLSFETVGKLTCKSGGEPNSMAIARDGRAFVRYSDETVWEIDLATAACASTPYKDAGFGAFGMGYSTNSADTWRDALYVANATTLSVLDTDTWKLTTVGKMPSQSELTGNAAGELWAFLPLAHPAQLVRVDKSNAKPLTTLKLADFPSASDIDTFAFATWGGEFWLFVRSYGMGESTDVYRVTADGKMTRELDNVGFDVVGAGVSTCAPTE